MSERWKMNRIGFVNFWLYDEEDYEFADGKLLLRGQNGSGKSITTQSFIPFVLDGDRTPSRLDPFGSSDRRMEYYFIGEEGKDESTGYLYLEFKKADSEEYRTIGIGQRAKRGKPMDFWGFVILDGRRIGTDMKLYKEVGSNRIPYDRREMKAVLGEGNFFTDSQSEYKKHVNQYIFGFRKADQYEQFIRLLVKVRAPKLSKEFKPTKVYEILNDSLQTLTDEDLRAMVDAMEKMDEIQDSLEMLNRAFADVKIIRTEYTRYNQYMLAKKAQAYIRKKGEVEKAQQALEVQKQEIQYKEEVLREKSVQLEKLEEQRRVEEAERNGLLDMKLEEIDHKLEYSRGQKEEAVRNEKRWDEKIREYQERIWDNERELKETQDALELKAEELGEIKEELDEQQETLQWEQHVSAVTMIENNEYQNIEEISRALMALKKLIEECKNVIGQYEELSRQYDEITSELEILRGEKEEKEQNLRETQEQIINSIDQWIVDTYELADKSAEWKPDRELLKRAEEIVREYQSVEDADAVQGLFRTDYEAKRQKLLDLKNSKEYEKKIETEHLEEIKEELHCIKNQEELEPQRDEETEHTRMVLQEMGITTVPFYKTVEFADGMTPEACARLEAQLQKMGILDTLVVSEKDFVRIKNVGEEFLDTVLYIEQNGESKCDCLTVRENLSPELKKSVQRILTNIYEEETGQGICLGANGWFRLGVLAGRADKTGEAEFVGILARQKRKEQKIQELELLIHELEEQIADTENEIARFQERLQTLNDEYQRLPDFSAVNTAQEKEKECQLSLKVTCEQYKQKEKQEKDQLQRKNQQYQTMLKMCKVLPYGRTVEAYEEAYRVAVEYEQMWNRAGHYMLQMETIKSTCISKKDTIDQNAQEMDDAFIEKRVYTTKVKEFDVQIRKYEEYLKRPDIAEKANRLKELKKELQDINSEMNAINTAIAVLEDQISHLKEDEPKKKESLTQNIAVETSMRRYFEEELSLKLVIDRENRTVLACAEAALEMLREADKNREATDMFQSLYQVYQRHNGSLANYGTSIEDCFEKTYTEENILRNRVRIISTWNGKKVYLEEFYKILKAAIDETELLIQQKDRELFEDILSQTISQQLTDRIAESRKWVSDMSRLMKEMDTSMGLSFSLDWKPRKAENDMELDIAELEQILLRDRALLTLEDIEKVAAHFRSRIRAEKMKLEENQDMINYMDLVRDALDYRKWFAFHMFFRKGEEQKKTLTNAAFNRFSGGEKAMAMYVPLFAAVNVQYKKAEKEDHPRIIALDEAFAGVDDKNISSMFELVHKLDFDYIMNSQALWGCFDTVRNLRIAELIRPQNSKTVSVIRYTWNGHERILDVQ